MGLFKSSMKERERTCTHKLLMSEEQVRLAQARQEGIANRISRPGFQAKYRLYSRKAFKKGWEACREFMQEKLGEVLVGQDEEVYVKLMESMNVFDGFDHPGPADVAKQFSEAVGLCGPEHMPSKYLEESAQA